MSKQLRVVIYQDLERDNKHGYEIKTHNLTEDLVVIKAQVIPGLYGYPDMYIRHIDTPKFKIISQTDYELTHKKVKEIVDGAVDFFYQHTSNN